MRGKHSAGGWVLDGLVWSAAAIFSVEMFNEAKGGMELAGLAAIFGIVVVTGISIVWIPLRMGRRVQELADMNRRMELATTFVKPGEYLRRNLWGVALRAALPAILAPPFLMLSLDWRNRSEWDASDVAQWLSGCCCFLWFVWIAWLGQVDWLTRLCRRNRGRGMIFVPFLWAVASLAIPAGLGWLSFSVFHIDNWVSESVGLASMTLFALIPLYVLWRRWVALCGVYYVFEKNL